MPVVFHHVGLSDTIVLAVIGIYAAVGAAYGFINVKDSAVDKIKDAVVVVNASSQQ